MAFNVPINSIAPTPTPPDWVRPADWITITDTPNEVQFLVCDTGAKAFTILTQFTRTTGNIYIDWGDGVINTISSLSTSTDHVYSTGGTPCSRGYNTWKIRIYGDPTCVITNAKHLVNFPVTGGSTFYNIGLLEAYFGDGTCSNNSFFSNYFTSVTTTIPNATFQLLEYVKLPATVTWTSQMFQMFQNCSSLAKVIMPTSAANLTNCGTVFSFCPNLLDVTFPSNSTGITNLSSAFINCSNLRTITLPPTLNSCTSMASMCTACSSLKNLTIPSVNLVTSFASAFSTCNSLQWIKFNSLPSPASPSTGVTASNMFQGSTQLQNVYFPSTCSSNAIYSAGSLFSGCFSLKNVVFPTNFNASSLNAGFQNNYSLTSIVFQSASPSLTDMSNCFNGCSLLRSITLPTTVGVTISLAGTFSSCMSLSSITIPSGWQISSLSSTFQFCYNITSINLPNNAQNNCTTMGSMASSCHKLNSIVMPTSLNAVSAINNIFGQCYELTSVVFPSSMNVVTVANSAFNSCYKVTSVTLPTSMSACTNFANMFQACFNIETITMPATVSANTTSYAQLVDTCPMLRTITLPTTQTSLLTLAQNMFNACGSLITINNLSKVGSLTATPLVLMSNNTSPGIGTNLLTTLSISCPLSKFDWSASSTAANFNKLNSLRLLNASAGQYTGASPQINVSYCDLGIAALNQLFTDLPTVTSKTINITGCTGAAGCTRSIATAKGWTVTG
jgi:hypothetical protein